MDYSPDAPASVSAPRPEEEMAEERCNVLALLPQLGLLPNTKQRLRRLVSGFGLIGTFSTLLLVVSLLLLFLQQYRSPTSSSASSSSSSASAAFYFLSWFLPPYGSTTNGSSASGATETLPQLSASQCDPFDGNWVKDDRPPYYPPGSCPFLDDDFNCHKNGRPDSGFLQWRWQPHGCSIPRLNATDFLSHLRGKKLVFVGDSLNRNMWESLVCILSNSIRDKNKVYEISRRKHFKDSSFYSVKFEDYQCSVDYVRSTFLVREVYQKHLNGSEDEKLRLDILDETTSTYRDADVIVFNTGHWWTHEKTSRGLNYYQEGDHVYPVLKVMEAFKKALATWARWVDMNINPNKTQVVFRGYSPIHFRGGRWNSGGQCHKESEPIMITSYRPKYPSKMKALEQILKTMRTPVIYLNISRLTSYRKDGHPSIYRKIYNSAAEQIAAEKSQDCSHWCLPGVPDTWNELLYASLLKIGQGTRKL